MIRRNANRTISGAILDGEGFAEGLTSAGHQIDDKNCVLYGAGGAASAIAFALAKRKCRSLCIVNRTQSKADSLAKRLQSQYAELKIFTEISKNEPVDIAINATNQGMKTADQLPIPLEVIDRAKLVAECVIAPEITPLIVSARSRGCLTHTGMPMLTEQLHPMLNFMGVKR